MSVKSLLQLILFLLIILIIGGIYYVYFFSKNQSNIIDLDANIYKIEDKIDQNNALIDQDVLENDKIKQNLDSNLDNNETLSEIGAKIEPKEKSSKLPIKENVSNVTKEIQHTTINKKNGDVYKIIAKYGKTNLKNSNILDLVEVDGTIISPVRSNVKITSDYAKYNYISYESDFYENVIIKYEGNTITCDNFNVNIEKNIAVAYNNVTVTNEDSIMTAEIITMDLITKDIKINSEEKVKIITN